MFQPNSIPTWKIGAVFALLAALGQASYLIIRRLLTHYSSSLLMFLNTLVGIVVIGCLGLFFEQAFYFGGGIVSLSVNTWLVTVLFGFTNFLAWFFMTKGFELYSAATGSLVLLTELIFGIVFALAFFGEIPTILSFVGGGLILISSVVVITRGNG
ncbi:MAG: DMT family transporter [Patescibacteria group bacterium]